MPGCETFWISTHTLHTEGDRIEQLEKLMEGISTHTLHTEGDVPNQLEGLVPALFQPTPSTRRVTAAPSAYALQALISTHTLHTEGDVTLDRIKNTMYISTHTLHTEGDGFR